MARQHRISESLKSIAGGTLVGVGLHMWFGNLHGVASQLTHALGTPAGDTLGLLPSVILATAQAGRVYTSDHQGFFLELLRMLLSFWPLLLVSVGAGFLRDAFTDEVDTLKAPEKYFQNNDTGCRFCCPSFDA
ncbi:MAG: hypothetical protein LAO18_17415 [Acidobacteriia bacterium]|nr:hypothetical protein [Terriglobia bacterium]